MKNEEDEGGKLWRGDVSEQPNQLTNADQRFEIADLRRYPKAKVRP